jgi:IS30 family transposase
MTQKYRRLSADERVEIYKLLALNKSISSIAVALGRNKSSISREIKNWGRKKYSPRRAHIKAVCAQVNRRYGKIKIRKNPKLEEFILRCLKKKWSPDQIHVYLRRNYSKDPSMQVSPETIYMYVHVHAKPELRKILLEALRQKRKIRGNVRRGQDKRGTIADVTRIDERPLEANTRELPGHWEGDLIMGKNRESFIGTLVERTTRAVILVHLKSKGSEEVRKAFEKKFNALPKLMKKSLTYDNGTEMAQHKIFTKNTKVKVYFAQPYSPWQRPTNENTNGLLRQYFPKGTDLSKITKRQLQFVQDEMNERPRRVLDYRSPQEVFDELILNKTN